MHHTVLCIYNAWPELPDSSLWARRHIQNFQTHSTAVQKYWKKILWWKTLIMSILPTGDLVYDEKKDMSDSHILFQQARMKSVTFEGRMKAFLMWISYTIVP